MKWGVRDVRCRVCGPNKFFMARQSFFWTLCLAGWSLCLDSWSREVRGVRYEVKYVKCERCEDVWINCT